MAIETKKQFPVVLFLGMVFVVVLIFGFKPFVARAVQGDCVGTPGARCPSEPSPVCRHVEYGVEQCDGSCVPAVASDPYLGPCDDGNACTTGEKMQCDGSCSGGTNNPVNAVCSDWSAWACSGNGRTRSRTYSSPSCGGNNVSCSPLIETESCDDGNSCTSDSCSGGSCFNTNNPVNGTLSGFGACSASCGGGTQTRTCTGASCGGDATCGGADLSQVCNPQACPVMCYSDTDCQACANPGTPSSYYSNKPDGRVCSSDNNSCTTDVCSSGNCTHPAVPPVNGGWSDKTCGNWGLCHYQGSSGSSPYIKSRSCSRTCTNPAPSCGGTDSACSGGSTFTEDTTNGCVPPTCSVLSDNPTSVYERSTFGHSSTWQARGGNNDGQTQVVNNGTFTAPSWDNALGYFGGTKAMDIGRQPPTICEYGTYGYGSGLFNSHVYIERLPSCSYQAPNCDDNNSCTTDACSDSSGSPVCSHNNNPVNGTLSGWSACSASCGGGTQTRTCTGASCGGDATCGGADLSQVCNPQACPVLCSSPSDCPNNNVCTYPVCNNASTPSAYCSNSNQPNGTACADDGNSCTTDVCSSGSCTHPAVAPVNGVCGAFGAWTCSGNSKTRSRSYTPPSCWGSDVSCSPETVSCDDNNSCTVDSCSSGACVNNPTGNHLVCQNNACTSVPNNSSLCTDDSSCSGKAAGASCGGSTPTVTLTAPPSAQVNTTFSISWVSNNADHVVLGSSIIPPAGCMLSPALSSGEFNGSRANVSCSTTGSKIFKITVANSANVEATDTKTVDITPGPGSTFILTIAKAGSGTGSATSTPAGINCGGSCSASYANNTSVTLSASPAAGSSFTGWSGGGCSGSGNCTILMDQDRTVTVTFSAVACSADTDCQVCSNPGTPSSFYSNKPDGTACTSDNNSCTNDICVSGVCSNVVSGNHLACSGNACVSVANTSAVCTNSCASDADCNGGGGGPPTPPGSPSASNPVCSQVKITWIDNSTNETGFKIFKDGSLLNPPGILPASSPPSATGGSMVYNYTPPDNNPHNYTVASVNGNGDSAYVPAVNNPVSSLACQSNLGSSSKTITTVNGSPYNPSVLLKIGDKLVMVITVDNSQGAKAATNISIVDRLTNLKIPSTGLNAVYDGTLITQGAGSGHYSLTGSEPNQTLTFDLTGSGFDVPTGSIRTLALELNIVVDVSFTGSNSRMQNSAAINYSGGTQNVSTPLTVFSVSSGSPDIHEVPPGQ